ncbi:glycosyltransferase family 1 protein [Vibrio mediterranei]|uniref:glycosyltransferase family 4 protein n=1 Tax=Vibrio mediterranei TaxID=689 RepID=UPI0009ED405B|nr:glycosyltransferase family 4 protein [Vibrio mediterranei]PTC02954.1 glycosyltransferase family 1 protein [Vibrio mediterranei]
MRSSMGNKASQLTGQVLYIHPAIRTYRRELFERLSKSGVDFFWSASPRRGEKGKSHSYTEINTILSETDIAYYQAKDTHRVSIDGLSFDLLKIPFWSHKIVVFSNIVSVPFLLLAPFVKLFGKQVVVFDELWRYPKEIRKYRLLYQYVNFLTRYCVDRVVAAGTKARDFYIDEFDFPKDSIAVAYNTTVDSKQALSSEDKNSEVKRTLDSLSSNSKILYLGRVIKYKGLDVLIKAMKDVDVSHDLVVVGDGDDEYKKECLALIQELDLESRVHFLGPCESSDAPYYYQHCDFFVLPTRFRLDANVQMESWGFTVNEAMALEKPVIATEAVGSAYDLVVDGKTGYVAKAGDSESLARSVNLLIENNSDNVFGINARKLLLEKCNYSSNHQAYMRVFEELIDAK